MLKCGDVPHSTQCSSDARTDGRTERIFIWPEWRPSIVSDISAARVRRVEQWKHNGVTALSYWLRPVYIHVYSLLRSRWRRIIRSRRYAVKSIARFAVLACTFLTTHGHGAYIHISCEWKKQYTLFLPITSASVDRFSKSFTIELSSDCVTNWSLKSPSHLKRVATLPCGTFMFKNWPN